MDISLPVSEGSAAAAFAASASSRSVDGGKFSQTLSKEMSGQPDKESVSDKADAPTKQTQPETASSLRHTENAEQSAPEEAAADSAEENPTESAAEPGKGTKKSTEDTREATPMDPGANKAPALIADEQAQLATLKLLTGTDENTAADTTEKTVTPAALDKASNAAANSVLANGSTNPALQRSNAIHNEIFNSLRTPRGEAAPAAAGTYADSLAAGKSLHSSGKTLPGSAKAEKADTQLNGVLSAGAQDWKTTADSLITAVSDKAAKFEALSTHFDSKSTEAFSLVNTGSGKSLLATQSGFKTDLASTAPASTALTSEFLAGSEEWCQDFGTKIEWLNNENITKAELSLHPAELGVLDITINTEDDRISINIVTHNEKSREMLESSLPRLTELLKSQGLALENSNISHNSSSDKQNAHPQQAANTFSLSAEEKHAAELGTVRSALIRHQGQIDHYV